MAKKRNPKPLLFSGSRASERMQQVRDTANAAKKAIKELDPNVEAPIFAALNLRAEKVKSVDPKHRNQRKVLADILHDVYNQHSYLYSRKPEGFGALMDLYGKDFREVAPNVSSALLKHWARVLTDIKMRKLGREKDLTGRHGGEWIYTWNNINSELGALLDEALSHLKGN